MTMSPQAGLPSSSPRAALSWADAILIVLILVTGVEAWRGAARVAGSVFPTPEPVPAEATRQAIARHEQDVQRGQAEVAALRSAVLRQWLDAARARATLAALGKSRPDAEKASPEGGVPPELRAAYVQARLDLDVGSDLLGTISVDLARAESELSNHAASLESAQRDRETALAQSRVGLQRRRRLLSLALSAGATAAVLLLAWVALPSEAGSRAAGPVHRRSVLGISATGLGILAAHMTVGAAGALVLGLVLAGIALNRLSRTERHTFEGAAP